MRETKRLQKELTDIQTQSQDSDMQVTAHMIGDDVRRWKGYLKGPMGTPYEGGHYTLDIEIPNDYPYTAPKMKFETRIWHPNISSQTGAICLDILKNEWSPALTIRTALLSIQALLSSPEPDSSLDRRAASSLDFVLDDPMDNVVATMYKHERERFDQTARLWCEMFARPQNESHDVKIAKLTEMGFSRDQVVEVLRKHEWNETIALNELLGG